MKTNRIIKIACLLPLVAMFAGCQSLSRGKPWFSKEEVAESKTPSKMVTIWTNSVFNESGRVPVRGLGGRVYFYDSEHKPVPVDGQLSVFLYDDSEGKTRSEQEAAKKVHFTSNEVAQNYTPSDFGPSYSFWVPFDRVGGERKQLSVIPVFTDAKGRMIVGDQARHVLPGKVPELADAKKPSGVSTANYETSGSDQGVATTSATVTVEEDGSRVVSSTIKLPPTMQKRLRNPAPNRTEKARSLRTSSLRRRSATQTQRTMANDSAANDYSQAETTETESSDSGNGDATATQPSRSELDPHRALTSQFGPQDPFHAPTRPYPGGSQFVR